MKLALKSCSVQIWVRFKNILKSHRTRHEVYLTSSRKWQVICSNFKKLINSQEFRKSIAIGALPLELSFYQVLIVSTANWPWKFYFCIRPNIGLRLCHHQSLICIFYSLMLIFKNGKWRFLSFAKFHVIHPKTQGANIWLQKHVNVV